jgi:ornithine cyclodeaminase/alanine dehydrogenase-like protein (mu-crystallin family)
MALLLTQTDLMNLTRSNSEIAHAIDAIEACVVASHKVGRGQTIFGDLEIDDANYMKVLCVSAPHAGMSVHAFPGQGNATNRYPDDRLMLLFAPDTGSLQAVLAGDDLNALRTSVPAALGARYLAPPGAKVLGILGSGYQAASHLRTISVAAPQLSTVFVWSPTQANRERFAEEQSQLLGLPVEACDNAEDVVGQADVLTATGSIPTGRPAYAAEWVKPGALMISITRSVPAELMRSARRVVPTRRRPEVVAFGFNGPIRPHPIDDPDGTVELIDVIEGRVDVRDVPDRTVFWELAQIYLWDVAIARWAHDWAVDHGVGYPFALGHELSGRAV